MDKLVNGAPMKTVEVSIDAIIPTEYNPRKWSTAEMANLKKSIERFGIVDPAILNKGKGRENILIGGHMRIQAAKELGYKTVPAVFVDIPDIEREKELNIRLNKNTGEFDFDLLAKFDESFLADIGFSNEEMDEIFDVDIAPEEFSLKRELEKLNIHQVNVRKGDIYALGDSKIMCGDSMVEADMLMLMNGEKADFCLTDPPYILDYLNGKRHGKATTGFGAKKNRRYLETDVLPPDFTEKWMANVAKVQQESFSIIVYENWKNLRTIWVEMERYWSIKNMIVWHIPTRHQGFASKYRFFSKHDIAMVGASPNVDIPFNLEVETDGLQEEYETALFGIAGKPHWESYRKGKKNQPTDFIEFNADDEKNSGQGVVFGTKPVAILIPYIKVLTKRGDLILEPFGGSGSTLIAATKMKRRCFVMEKVPAYTEVIMKRWEKSTGQKAKKL